MINSGYSIKCKLDVGGNAGGSNNSFSIDDGGDNEVFKVTEDGDVTAAGTLDVTGTITGASFDTNTVILPGWTSGNKQGITFDCANVALNNNEDPYDHGITSGNATLNFSSVKNAVVFLNTKGNESGESFTIKTGLLQNGTPTEIFKVDEDGHVTAAGKVDADYFIADAGATTTAGYGFNNCLLYTSPSPRD